MTSWSRRPKKQPVSLPAAAVSAVQDASVVLSRRLIDTINTWRQEEEQKALIAAGTASAELGALCGVMRVVVADAMTGAMPPDPRDLRATFDEILSWFDGGRR